MQGNVSIEAPNLTLLSKDYLERQLLHFKRGIRGSHPEDDIGQEMRPMLSELSDRRIAAIAKYISRLPEISTPSYGGLVGRQLLQRNFQLTFMDEPLSLSDNAVASTGEILYERCVSCHGETGQGNDAMGAPALAGQHGWYLVRQLKLYQSGARGGHEKDNFGALMRTSIAGMKSDELEAVAVYLSSMPVTTEQ